MADALVINGVPVLVAPGAAADVLLLGEITRGQRGGVRDSRRRSSSGKQRLWDRKYTSTPLSVSDAEAVQALVEGDGHTLSFDSDSLYSSRGVLGVVTGSGGTTGSITRYGGTASRALFLINNSASAAWALQLPTTWTIIHWRFGASIGTWRHYVFTSAGGVWQDGASSSSTAGMAVSAAGALTVSQRHAAGTEYIDDVVALPYVVPAAWVPLLYTRHVASAFPALPKLSVTGERFGASTVTARGQVTSERNEGFAESGTWVEGARFQFTLMEE